MTLHTFQPLSKKADEAPSISPRDHRQGCGERSTPALGAQGPHSGQTLVLENAPPKRDVSANNSEGSCGTHAEVLAHVGAGLFRRRHSGQVVTYRVISLGSLP